MSHAHHDNCSAVMSEQHTSDGSPVAIDPVCGMSVRLNADKPWFDYRDERYHFCASRCRERFADDPWFYLTDRHKLAEQGKAEETFTCPMCPEIVTIGPATCSICGMALEPESGITDEPNHELHDFTRRMWWSLALALPLIVIAMGPMLGISFAQFIGEQTLRWLELALATPIVVWLAAPVFKRGWQSVLTRHLNMWTLIMLGVGAAYLFSVTVVLFPQIFPETLVAALANNKENRLLPVFFEAAAVIIALVFVGQVLELRARERTGDAIRALLELAPDTVRRVLPDGEEYDAPLANILPGDRLRVRPGDRIPVDGIIEEGVTSADESLLTGEAMPIAKARGDQVAAGTINIDGTMVLNAEAVGNDTALGRIVGLVASAQRSRSPLQALADKVAGFFVPVVLLVAVLAFAFWWWLGPVPSLAFAITAAVSVLIIACPCALGLATPMSVMIASGRGAQAGILIRDAASLDKLAQIKTIVLDKTGTVTEGRPVVTDIVQTSSATENIILSYAAALETGSTHPLATAIITAANENTAIDLQTNHALTEFESIPGLGVQARSDAAGNMLRLGNRRFMEQAGVVIAGNEKVIEHLDKLESEAKTVVLLAIDNEIAGLIACQDAIKPTAKQALAEIRAQGIQVVLATGDNAGSAEQVAQSLGISDVHSSLLPEHKLSLLSELQSSGQLVAMVGDGINDAPALAIADVGIAMGGGSDVALESADIALMHSDLDKLVEALRLAKATRTNIKQNLFFAFAYNAIGIPVAAGLLYPLFGLLLSPMLAAAAMACSSVLVISNALRLQRVSLAR